MAIHDLQLLLTGMAIGVTIQSIIVALWLIRKGYTSVEQVKDYNG